MRPCHQLVVVHPNSDLGTVLSGTVVCTAAKQIAHRKRMARIPELREIGYSYAQIQVKS